MMVEVQSLVDRYLNWVRDKTAIRELGDIIEIDIPNRTINVRLSDEELALRRQAEIARGKEAFTPKDRNRVVSKALRAYASMVSSADKGAVRMID